MTIQTDLSMQDFTKYFEVNRLGNLYFPNGVCQSPSAVRGAYYEKFHVPLRDLYKLATDWKVNRTEVSLDDILAVITFGSAVKFPGYEKVPKRKYILFGPEVKKQVPIAPKDADFLVLTKEANLKSEKTKKASLTEVYDSAPVIRVGGIHLIRLGVEQFIDSVYSKDSVALSVLEQGVPVFYDKIKLEEVVVRRAKIYSTTPRRLFWDEDDSGNLTGKID